MLERTLLCLNEWLKISHSFEFDWKLKPLIRSLLQIGLFISISNSLLLAVQPGEILPKNVEFNQSIPTPQEYFGFKIGKRHLYHHELLGYMHQLAKTSERVTIKEYARSYGGRSLVMVFITSPSNQENLEAIRQQHVLLADPGVSKDVDIQSLPAVINMGYSVHGNEPSAGNAAPLVAYYLAAAKGEEHDRLLNNVVISLDPCLNPDGFERFAHWANNYRGKVLNPDPNHREHNESAPSGRTNYYWFDLNRDWLPVQHPESQGRIELFHRWKPNVVLDFHEMGTNATYFFQPGVPKRNHPLTPQRNFELTRAFADYHAAALDKIGSLYFTEENFDDFYMGKGSTYPDLHGSIGILFEQASARGHLQESVNGPISFAFAIRNQYLTSMSSLKATLERRVELLEYMRTFYQDATALARNDKVKGYVVTAPDDPVRLHLFLEVLERHQIHAHLLSSDLRVNDRTYRGGKSFVIRTEQPGYRFIQALFESRTEFEENIFYDVSTWTLPAAFNLQYSELATFPTVEQVGELYSREKFPQTKLKIKQNDLAYIVDWKGYYAPKILYQLLGADVKVKVATKQFRLQFGAQEKNFSYGTLLIPLGIQHEKRDEVVEIMKTATENGVQVYTAKTGKTPSGIDFGSSNFIIIPKPRILLVTGEGVNSYEAGEAWHLLDRRVEMPVTLVDGHDLGDVELRDYTAIVMVSGSYSSLRAKNVEQLKRYAAEGGTIVAVGTAIKWMHTNKIVSVKFRSTEIDKEKDKKTPTERRPYADSVHDKAFKLVRGSIMKTYVDHTHPIGYAFSASDYLPVFRNNTVILEPAENVYSTPVIYDKQPLLSGYVSSENLELLKDSAGVVVHSSGKGRVVLMAENPNFRGFWLGTNRIFLNALFFGPIIKVP